MIELLGWIAAICGGSAFLMLCAALVVDRYERQISKITDFSAE